MYVLGQVEKLEIEYAILVWYHIVYVLQAYVGYLGYIPPLDYVRSVKLPRCSSQDLFWG